MGSEQLALSALEAGDERVAALDFGLARVGQPAEVVAQRCSGYSRWVSVRPTVR